MTTAFDQVKVDPSCLVQECEKQGCCVDLSGVPKPFHLIDMDLSTSPRTARAKSSDRSPAKGARCDYLFIGVGEVKADDLYVVPMELKSSSFNAGSVSKQLKGGAKAASKVVPGGSCRFIPVVVSESARRHTINQLKSHRVTFRGSKYAIKFLRCGASLSEVL